MKLLTPILIIASLLLVGCSKNIQGEAYIVTKDRNTIKLSLLDIHLIPLDEMKKIMLQVETEQKARSAEIVKNSTTLRSLSDERKRLEAAIPEGYIPLEQELSQIFQNFRSPNPEAADLEEILAYSDQGKAWKVKAENYKKFRIEAEGRIEKIKIEQSELVDRSNELLSSPWSPNLPDRIQKSGIAVLVKTDAEGRFNAKAPSNEFALYSEVVREYEGKTEHYAWMLENPITPLVLNNDNLKKN
jgi:hypothetical protein